MAVDSSFVKSRTTMMVSEGVGLVICVLMEVRVIMVLTSVLVKFTKLLRLM